MGFRGVGVGFRLFFRPARRMDRHCIHGKHNEPGLQERECAMKRACRGLLGLIGFLRACRSYRVLWVLCVCLVYCVLWVGLVKSSEFRLSTDVGYTFNRASC